MNPMSNWLVYLAVFLVVLIFLMLIGAISISA
jgi:hypothetical protein